MAKKIDPKAKAKRQKIYAAVGGVLLLAVLAFQVPRTLKMLHPADPSSSSPPPATTTSGSTPTPISAPSLSGGNASAGRRGRAGGDGISDPDAVPPPQSGQLLAFGLFRTKDPFVQQLDLKGTTGSTGVLRARRRRADRGDAVGSGAARAASRRPARRSRLPPRPTRAADERRDLGQRRARDGPGRRHIPAADPYFKLVSLTKKGAKISIAGGSLENGAPTVTLTKNKALTLMNTADGTRYVLRLVSVS